MPVHIPPGGLPEASPIILSENGSHIVVAVEIAKTTLARHRRFLEMRFWEGGFYTAQPNAVKS
jgi:hypothetical protein